MSEPPRTESPSSDQIEITVPLRSVYLSTLRTVAASLGADAGFSIDEIDDVRLGIGEVVAALIEGAGDRHQRVMAAFAVGAGEIVVDLQVVGGDTAVELDDLATGILHSVVDRWEVTDTGVVLAKRATEVAGLAGDTSPLGT